MLCKCQADAEQAESVSFGSGIKVEERRVLPMDVQVTFKLSLNKKLKLT